MSERVLTMGEPGVESAVEHDAKRPGRSSNARFALALGLLALAFYGVMYLVMVTS